MTYKKRFLGKKKNKIKLFKNPLMNDYESQSYIEKNYEIHKNISAESKFYLVELVIYVVSMYGKLLNVLLTSLHTLHCILYIQTYICQVHVAT